MPGRLLSYRIYGQVDRSALLLLHGFLGCKEDWEEVASALSLDYHVIAVDLPGHGKSIDQFSEQDYSIAGSTTLLVELLDSLSVSICTPIGYSMGGRLALYFALHHPERCRGLVLESASPGLRTEPERSDRRARDNALADRLLGISLEQFLAEWYAQVLFGPLRESARFEEMLIRRRRNDPRGLALSLRNMGTGVQPSLWERLDSINFPLLLMCGERDLKFTRLAHEMAAAWPNSTTVTIENAGHTLHFEASARYIAAVQSFLGERE